MESRGWWNTSSILLQVYLLTRLFIFWQTKPLRIIGSEPVILIIFWFLPVCRALLYPLSYIKSTGIGSESYAGNVGNIFATTWRLSCKTCSVSILFQNLPQRFKNWFHINLTLANTESQRYVNGLFEHFESHVDKRYKNGPVKSIVDCAAELFSTRTAFVKQCKTLSSFFGKSKYPDRYVTCI